MREIKFRAWDTDHKRMFIPYTLGFFKRGLSIRYQSKNRFVEANAVLMQYTGRKDQRGNEIYEGDILHFDGNEWGGTGHDFAIEWDDSSAGFIGAGTAPDWSDWCEVIGNIYETPEIITGVKP